MKDLAIVVGLAIWAIVCHQAEGVWECYFCLNDCQNPAVKTCPGMEEDFSCFSTKLVLDENTLEIKDCILSDDSNFRNSCRAVNQISGDSCYVCDGDLCNLL